MTKYVFDKALFNALLAAFSKAKKSPLEHRWNLLEAAHITGQGQFRPHLHVHNLMLGLAWETRDWHEIAGQLFRISLVPIGHALGKLPWGNSGRSDVNAFKAMPPSPEVRAILDNLGARNT